MTKFFFPVIITLIISCTKDNNEQLQINYGKFILVVVTNEKLSSGEVVTHDAPAIIHVWKVGGRALETRSSTAFDGYAHDFLSGTTIKADYTYHLSQVAERVPVGNYLIYVALDEDSQVAKFAWSQTYVDVMENQVIDLKKAFTTHAVSGQYEPWDAAE